MFKMFKNPFEKEGQKEGQDVQDVQDVNPIPANQPTQSTQPQQKQLKMLTKPLEPKDFATLKQIQSTMTAILQDITRTSMTRIKLENQLKDKFNDFKNQKTEQAKLMKKFSKKYKVPDVVYGVNTRVNIETGMIEYAGETDEAMTEESNEETKSEIK